MRKKVVYSLSLNVVLLGVFIYMVLPKDSVTEVIIEKKTELDSSLFTHDVTSMSFLEEILKNRNDSLYFSEFNNMFENRPAHALYLASLYSKMYSDSIFNHNFNIAYSQIKQMYK